jgi:hypothetical protein
MKSQILKIAGVKSEKEFYKLFPDEASFMKKHGKAFKKAQFGAHIGGDYAPSPNMVNFNSLYDEADLSATGMTDAMRKKQAEKAAQTEAASGGGGMDMGGIDIGSIMSMAGGARNGTYIPKAYYGTNTNAWWDGMTTDTTTTAVPAGNNINDWRVGILDYAKSIQNLPNMGDEIKNQTRSGGVDSGIFPPEQPGQSRDHRHTYRSHGQMSNGVP